MVNDAVTKEELKEDKKSKKKKLPKEISQEILKKMFRSLLKAVGIMLYFIILNLAYSTMRQERLIGDIKVFASVFLVVGMVFLEEAYKKDNDSIAISGIEFLILSLHSLSIMHVITLFKYEFTFYLLTSSYVFSIYYVLKAIILYTKGRKEYLNSLSDISEIVKKDEPVIKEAKKRMDGEEAKKPNHNKKERTENTIKNNAKTNIEKSKPVKKKTTSKMKNVTSTTSKGEEKLRENEKKTTKSKAKTLKEEKADKESSSKKGTTKPKSKVAEEEKTKRNQTVKKTASKTKKVDGTKTEKKEKTKGKAEEIKTIEERKREDQKRGNRK